MKYFIKTFGCQMNVADSDFAAGCLESCGYYLADAAQEADVVVVNTCTVRQHAEDRALSYIGTLKNFKKNNPAARIYLMGCVASRLGESLKKRFPHLDGVVPAQEIERFADVVSSPGMTEKKSPAADRNNRAGVPSENCLSVRSSGASEFVTISRGCSNFCSYCIVPYVRGPARHRASAEILDEISSLASKGIGRITLLGQNVNSYSSDGVGFAALINMAASVSGVESIGFLTSHPKDMSDEIIIAAAREPKVRKIFHLPVQSGSDRILALMNRGYTRDGYLSLVAKIRKECPAAAITTDIIVGSPTETESDFMDTFSLAEAARLDGFFAFKYSPREGTASGRLADDVSQSAKEERLARILELQRSLIRSRGGRKIKS
ncbi:MAG: tRNA (N6-isopentenyl adenosine(37)-C2)-methylthiotransferase MiaB, partial [Endomicrobiia bacterium]|nr:tRNA (N6-isopentenyl adenosine(37)-C2)-methylthiotransferase MiaB [Endomicrobiia bacterium]